MVIIKKQPLTKNRWTNRINPLENGSIHHPYTFEQENVKPTASLRQEGVAPPPLPFPALRYSWGRVQQKNTLN